MLHRKAGRSPLQHRRLFVGQIDIGIDVGHVVVIVKGVRPGEQVVTEGGTALEDGMQVRTK